MKKMSFVAVLTMMYPMMVVAYTPTITDTNIRNRSYSVEEISKPVYNAGMALDDGAPVFFVFEDGTNKYYRYIAQDFTQYETIAGESIFSLTNTGNDYLNFYVLNGDDEFTQLYYYYTNLEGTNNHMDNPSGTINEDFIDNIAYLGGALKNTSDGLTINGNFYGNQVYGSATMVSYDGGAIHNTGTITAINGNFIGNDAKHKGGAIYNNGDIGTINGDFISNASYDNGSDDGGAIYNRNNINSIFGNFTRNHASNNGGAIYNAGTIDTLTGDFIENHVHQDGGAIHNVGTINNLTGDFMGNYSDRKGGAIYNSGSIDNLQGNFVNNEREAIYNTGTITSLTGNFIKNYSNSYGSAIYNTGTIDSLNGNFYNNSSSNYYGGAIYNRGTINSLTGDFYNNYANNYSGAIYNASTGVINFQGNVNFLTSNDQIYNLGTISTIGGTVENPTEVNLQSVYNNYGPNGTFNLNGYTNVHLATNAMLYVRDLNIGEHSTLYSPAGVVNVYGTFTNNGTWALTGGTLNRTYAGNGAIAIDGNVTSDVNLSGKNVVINPDKSLTVSLNNIKDADLTNNGKLWFGYSYGYDNTLDKALSNYGDVGNSSSLYADPSYIDQDFINNGTLYLTKSGELSHAITGTGSIYIYSDGDNVTVSANADNIGNTVSGWWSGDTTLNLTGGTISKYMSGNVLINEGVTVASNANNIGSGFTNNGMLNLTGGTLSCSIYGNGGVLIDEDKSVSMYAYYVPTNLTNDGTLILTGGTLGQSIPGNGNITIDGDVTVNSNISQAITVNEGASLAMSVENMQNANLTNNGTMWFNGGTLDKALSNYDVAGNKGSLYTNTSYIDQDFINNGTLYLTTSGELSHAITGVGSIYIGNSNAVTNVTVSANADNIGNTVNGSWYGNTILNLTGGTISKHMYGNVLINEGVTVTSNADNIGSGFTNNGTLNLLGGNLSYFINGDGNVLIGEDKSVSAYAGSIPQHLTNNGTLTLTSGTLTKDITGSGEIVIDGDVNSDIAISQPITINENKSLGVPVGDALAGLNLTNYGTLWFNGGTLNTPLSDYSGIAGNRGYMYVDTTYIDQDLVNNGTLRITGGEALTHNISGTGTIYINSGNNMTANADCIGNPITNYGTVTLIGGTLSTAMASDGANYGKIYIDGDVISDVLLYHKITINPEKSLTALANNINNTVTNNGTLNLTGGTLSKSVTGSGETVIDGDVYSSVNMGQRTIINADKSLQVSVDNIKNTDLTNNGTLWFYGGTLDKALSNYGNAGIQWYLYADADYIDQDITNNGTLYLNNSGTLSGYITGTGSITIYSSVNVSANADYLGNNVSNSGTLNLTGGTLSKSVTGNGNIVIASGNTVSAKADYLGNSVSNSGTLTLTSGELTRSVTGSGTMVIEAGESISATAYSIGNNVTNSGTLTLTDGTLSKAISGSGEMIVAGNITAEADIKAQHTTINPDNILTISANNITYSNLTNNGTLRFNNGSLDGPISNYGDFEILNLGANADYIDIDLTNNGSLWLSGGTLSKAITGNGYTYINGDVSSDVDITQNTTIYNNGGALTINADNIIANTFTNNGTLHLTGGTLSKSVTGSGTIDIDDDITIASNANYLGNTVTNNGILTLTDGTLSKSVTGNGTINIDDDITIVSNANYLGNTVTNNGTLNLTGGTLAKSVTGDGDIIISGDVILSSVNIAQNTTINENSTLTASVNNIKDAVLSNYGTLKFNQGTLDKALSNYGNVINISGSTLYAAVEYLDNDFVNDGSLRINTTGVLSNAIAGNGTITIVNGNTVTTSADNLENTITNNGTLTLTGGTLEKAVSGSYGNIVIDGDVISYVNMAQSTTINAGKSLRVSLGNIQNTNLTNYGQLWLRGSGTLNKALSNFGNEVNIDTSGFITASLGYINQDLVNNGGLYFNNNGTLSHAVTGNGTIYVYSSSINVNANADNLGNAVTNYGTLTLTGGTLSKTVTGSGSIIIYNGRSVSANADYLRNTLTNYGTLTLTGGTLTKTISGSYGSFIIDGDVYSNVTISRPTTINAGKSLHISASGITSDLTNNGTLWFTGGSVGTGLSHYGNVGIDSNSTVSSSVAYIDQDVINNGVLRLTSNGTLTHHITGDGTINIDSGKNISVDAEYLGTAVVNNGSLSLSGGTLSKAITGNGYTYINGDVLSNVDIAQYTLIYSNGGVLTINADKIMTNAFFNEGTLHLTGGTLSKSVTGSGTIDIDDDITIVSNANYLGNTVTNNGTLNLTGGTLSKSVTGSGTINIDDDITIVSNANYLGNTVTNNGTLNLTGGTLAKSVTGDGDITIDNGQSIYANADYLGNSIVNDGTLNLTGGTLSKSVTGLGTTAIASGNTVSADASYIDTAFTNNGTLNLSGGTLSRSISGSGNIVIDGDVISDVNMVRTHINSEKSLRISADNITANTLTNDGSLILTGGTLSKSVSGNGQIVIDGDVSSGTYTSIDQEIIINPEKSLTTYYAYYIGNNITNDGTLNLTNGTLYHSVTGSGNIVLDNTASISANADYIGNAVTNNGTITLTGGTLSQTVSGTGDIVINGAVTSDVNITQTTTICSGKSLTVSVDNIKNVENLTNYGTLWFNDGILNRNVSYYANLGDVGNIGDVYANANYIDRVLTNNGTLSLTGGTLRQLVTGSGDIIIDGDVISDVDLTQDTTINIGKSLTTSFAHVAATNISNNGMLWFNDGTLTKNISSYGNTGNVGVLHTNANYLDADFENNNMLYVMGGILTHTITGTGHIIVDNNLRSDASYIGNDVTNNGTLTLTGGMLTSSVTGPGTTYIDGDVVADVNVSQNTTINSGKTLTISAEHVNSNSFVNNGSLYLTGGTISNAITGSGHTIIANEIVNNAQNNNVIDITNTGYLTTNGNNLLNTANINNNGVLNITNGTLSQDINGGNTIVGNNAIISSKSVANIDMNGTWNIDSNVVSATTANINGIVNLNIDRLYKDSNTYVGGKLIADNINLGDASELRLVVAENDLVKGDSTGYLQLIQSGSWTGNWRNILQNNAKYTMDIDEINHSIKFTYFRTGQDIIQEQSNSQNIYVVFVAWDQESFSDNPVIQQIIDKLNYASQYNTAEYVDMLNSIAPTDSNVISGTSSTLNTAINNQVSDRLTFVGRNGGDAFDGVGVWGQGLYNHSSQSGSSTFAGNTLGFSLGADKKISDNSVLGLGYTLSQTSATSGTRKIDATGNTVFAYGEYRPHKTQVDKAGNVQSRTVSPLYVNAVLSYGVTSYSENAGYGISSEYSTNTLGINGNIGYGFTDDIDVFVGARYLQISQNEYTDNIGQTISTQDDSIITARFGGKYIGTNMKFAPTAHLELSYDITSNDRLAVVNTGHTSYNISGEAINPFGVQTGIGFISNINNWNLSLNYDFEWRPDFISHTGRIKAKYVF